MNTDIQSATERFLAKGGKIKQLPTPTKDLKKRLSTEAYQQLRQENLQKAARLEMAHA